jgi:hypothetical protein
MWPTPNFREPVAAPNNRAPNKITCSTVPPNGRTVGSYVNQLSNSISRSAGNPTSTPYGPGPNPSAPGPLTVASQVYSGTNFKIMFRGQGNAAFLGDAGNFAYSAVSGKHRGSVVCDGDGGWRVRLMGWPFGRQRAVFHGCQRHSTSSSGV